MATRFTLQRVLDLKKRHEDAIAAKLADARASVEAARESEAEIDEIRRKGLEHRTAGGSVPVGLLMNASFVIERLDEQLEQARKVVQTAEAHEKTCLTELTAAMQERRVLDRLKERRTEEANAEEARLDQTTMDAIALTRFVRSEKSDSEGES